VRSISPVTLGLLGRLGLNPCRYVFALDGGATTRMQLPKEARATRKQR
jgi:hypothetical protein